jgi:hypothetical protein
MCDPGSLLSTGVGAGTKVMDAMGRQKAAQQQDKANKDHAMMKLMLMNQHMQTQNAFRGQAEGAWSAALDDMSASTQIARQSQESARLASYLNGDSQPITNVPYPASLGNSSAQTHAIDTGPGGKGIATYTDAPTSDKTVVAPASKEGGFSFDPSIQGSKGGTDLFRSDLARKLNIAARGARGQINALADLSAYGGSYGGLGTVNPLILQKSGQTIDLFNNFRRGDMNVYNVERRIPASQYQYKQSPAMGLAGLFGSGMKGMGEAAGSGGGFF